MDTWDKLPLDLMDEFAQRESYSRYHYRPIYSLHKWWARRPGSTFRILCLAALTDEETTKDDLLRRGESGSYDGLYLNHENEFSDNTILDPFAGGGTTLVEANRLGAQTIGYELNPVAWWTIKKSIEEVKLDKLQDEYKSLISDVRSRIGEYFETVNPETGESDEILYTFLTQKINCLTCDEKIELFPRYKISEKRSTAPAALYCPSEHCEDRLITLNREIENEEKCPNCGTTFDPSDGNTTRGKYTCTNGHKHDVMETLQRQGDKPKFDHFAIQYANGAGDKKYKTPDDNDRNKIEEIEERFQSEDDWLYPEQEIPEGYNTRQITNWNYERFSELFTTRQLLAYSELFKRANEVSDTNIREFLITAISNSLSMNSKLSSWDYARQLGQPVFKRHAYIPRVQPIEANPINERGGRTSVDNFFESLYKAKQFCEQPYEKVKNVEKGETVDHEMLGETVSSDRLKALRCSTAEALQEEDNSVDYIITDPPYYDNVMYSELSDYYYVWLRECLGEDYVEFKSDLVPKAREIVANSKVGKDDDFFVESLSNVFSECYRVLDSEDGEMIFTYHHNENEAWSVILRSIIKSGFTVTGAYPVQSERSNNPHITDFDNAEYDILLFCNEEDTEEEITLSELRDDLYFEVQDMLEEERMRHENLSLADLGVVLRGKCLYYYSRHYPKVYSEGQRVSVGQALETVDSVIEQVVEGTVDLPPAIDQLSRSYAGLVERGSESYNDLNKQLMSKGLNVRDLEEEKLVEGPRNQKSPVPGQERIEHIERKLDGRGADDNAEDVLNIDMVHYLAHLYRTEQNTIEYLKAWKSDDLEELADFIADATGDDTYARVMEMNLMQF